jgi:hypothetical protein
MGIREVKFLITLLFLVAMLIFSLSWISKNSWIRFSAHLIAVSSFMAGVIILSYL